MISCSSENLVLVLCAIKNLLVGAAGSASLFQFYEFNKVVITVIII